MKPMVIRDSNGFTTAGGAFVGSRVKDPLTVIGLVAVGVLTSMHAPPANALFQPASPGLQTSSGAPLKLPEPASPGKETMNAGSDLVFI